MKNKLSKCFACWSGFGDCKRDRLPRKKKKELKKFINIGLNYYGFMDHPNSCDFSQYYERFKKAISKNHILEKFKKEIETLKNGSHEEIFIDENGRLCWHWECDSDYGGSSGLMPIEYSELASGETWAYSEIVSTIRYMTEEEIELPLRVNSDVKLLKFIKKINQP